MLCGQWTVDINLDDDNDDDDDWMWSSWNMFFIDNGCDCEHDSLGQMFRHARYRGQAYQLLFVYSASPTLQI